MKRFTPLLAILAVLVAVMGISSSGASARPYGIDTEAGGVCGGGNNISNLVKGWEEHGAINQAIATTGSHVHLDGTAQQIAQKGFVWVIVTKGTWVHNTTCNGHGFTPISSMKFVPAGSRVPVPAWEAPAPGKKGNVKNSFDPHCGNLHPHSRLPVRRPGKKRKKPKPKPKPASVTCAVGFTKNSANQCAQVVVEGPKTSGAGNCNSTNSGNLSGTGDTQGSCNVTTVVCNGSGSCSPSTTNTCTAAASGGTGGTGVAEACTEEVVVIPPCECEPPPPPPPPPCETCECKSECKPPPPLPPTVEFENPPKHVYTTDTVQVCADAFAPNGDGLRVKFETEKERGTVSSTFQPDLKNSPQKFCTIYTAPSSTGSDTITVTATDTTTGFSDSETTPTFPNPDGEEGF